MESEILNQYPYRLRDFADNFRDRGLKYALKTDLHMTRLDLEDSLDYVLDVISRPIHRFFINELLSDDDSRF